jgi:hypothetical protein
VLQRNIRDLLQAKRGLLLCSFCEQLLILFIALRRGDGSQHNLISVIVKDTMKQMKKLWINEKYLA